MSVNKHDAPCLDTGAPFRAAGSSVTGRPTLYRQALAEARDLGLDALADVLLEIPDIAPDAASGRLRFEVLRWYLSKLAPKRYGERLEAAAKAALSHEEALRELE